MPRTFLRSTPYLWRACANTCIVARGLFTAPGKFIASTTNTDEVPATQRKNANGSQGCHCINKLQCVRHTARCSPAYLARALAALNLCLPLTRFAYALRQVNISIIIVGRHAACCRRHHVRCISRQLHTAAAKFVVVQSIKWGLQLFLHSDSNKENEVMK